MNCLRTKHDSARKNGTETVVAHCPPLTTTRKDRAMAAKPLPSQDVLRQLLSYDEESGMLFWKESGRPAIASLTSKGYLRGRLLGRNVMAHRVVWKWTHGTEPVEIDHIDGNPSNNRILNLRNATRQDNVRNTRIRTTNKSGVQGVYRHCNRWVATIRTNGKQIDLGRFINLEDAASCRRKAEQEYGYHPNHGRTLSVNEGIAK